MVNEVRAEIEKALEEEKSRLEDLALEARLKEEVLDVTLPSKKNQVGHRHPNTIALEEVERIFVGMGYEVVEGPEVEKDYYNFEALNIPKDHPARDEQDTFYINDEIVLRTQTSPVQVRTMEKGKLPIRMIAPGRVFRSDEVDATHSPSFHQIEGLVIDKNITFADLKGTLAEFAKELFGESTKVKFRPHHFPFTEPSAEVDVSCFKCGGKGCRFCKGSGWIEILGCGMVHPKVLRMSVSRHAGRWMASLTVERKDGPMPTPLKGGSVGIDLGVKQLATLSDGTIIRNPRALDSNLRRLRREQKNLSRKRKGSNRRREARTRVARLHARVADLRRDLLDKTTTMLARTYADISIEDLNVAGMVRNHRLARSVEDAAFAEFRRQLEYKTARTGARLHVIDRWYPSSKTCSNCGTVKAKLSLSERVYHCEECGLVIDRDLNAAISIQRPPGSAPGAALNARGGSGRRADASRRATRHPVKREPSGGVSRVRLGAGLGNEAMQMTSL